jgi:PPOX class probable F420-dependent enzyme
VSKPLFDAAVKSQCMKIRSFRKDGTPVDTPTWVVVIDGKLCCYTDDRSYKVKRLRRNPSVEVSACDVWGLRSTGWYPGTCRLVQDEEEEPLKARIYAALKEKYGIHWWLSFYGSLLVDRIKHRVVLELTVAPDAAPLA